MRDISPILQWTDAIGRIPDHNNLNVKMAIRRDRRLGRGFTVIELIAAVCIVSILAAFLVPCIYKVQEANNQIVSVANLRQCLAFLRSRSDENNGILHINNATGSWIQVLWSDAYPTRAFPAWKNDASNLKGTFFYDPGIRYDLARNFGTARTFGINSQLYETVAGAADIKFINIEMPASTALLATVGSKDAVSSNLMRTQINFRFRNATIANIGFLDGHVQSMNKEDLAVPLETYENVFWKGKKQ